MRRCKECSICHKQHTRRKSCCAGCEEAMRCLRAARDGVSSPEMRTKKLPWLEQLIREVRVDRWTCIHEVRMARLGLV